LKPTSLNSTPRGAHAMALELPTDGCDGSSGYTRSTLCSSAHAQLDLNGVAPCHI